MRMTPFRAGLSASLLLSFLVSTGCQGTRRVVDYYKGNTPGKYARMMENAESPDARRTGINKLVERDFARKEPYVTRYRQIFETAEEPLLRATAIRALNVSRDTAASNLYIKALGDADPLVRLEGAKALTNMPDDAAIDALLRVLAAPDETQDVRLAVAAALRHYPRRDVARALVAVLDERNFGVVWQARRSLRAITGVDRAYDGTAWLEYISNPTQPLGG